MRITLQVNGIQSVCRTENEDLTLMAYLREELRLTSVKNGCGEGHCGACTVILNGRAVLSCRKKMYDLEGGEVITLEALSDEEGVHPLIYAFLREGAVQCGFCTSGFIMSAKALLDDRPDPSEQEIRRALAKNVCRCTGYVKILKAVRLGAELLRGGRRRIRREEILPQRKVALGESVIRIDSLEKGTGNTVYADDMFVPGMLHTAVLRSSCLHGEIISLDVAEAKRSPGVVRIITAADIPGENRFGPIRKDQPVLAEDRVRYTGDAVAAVFAESAMQARRAVEKIQAAYRELPPHLTLEDSLAADAPELHPGTGNLIAEMEAGRGDVVAEFRRSHLILERELETQYVEHGYLEPESCIAELEADGGLTVHVASQGPPMDAEEIAPVVGIPKEKIRIAGMPMGGGFGGKEDISVQIIASLGAVLTGRPVKYTFSRRESIRVSGKRNSVRMRYRTGFDREGHLKAVQAEITARGGAYASVTEAVILRSCSFAAGPYTLPAADIRARGVYLNHPPACAMRGFGNPTVTFGAETVMNMAADELGMDPIELRLKNVLGSGAPTLTGDRPIAGIGIAGCLSAVKEAMGEYSMPKPRKGWKVGVGIAASYKNVGLGIGMNDSAGARGEILSDGTLELRVGCVDMGQGSSSAMAQILSDRLGWPFSRIRVSSADTVRDPLAGMTTASRQTFVSGNAVLKMAEKLEKAMGDFLVHELGSRAQGAHLEGESFCSGPKGAELIGFEDFLSLIRRKRVRLSAEAEYAAPATSFSLKEPPGGWPSREKGRLHAAYCFAAQATVLEVDPATGRVNVLDVIIASDAGRVINRAAVEGQMEGVIMGLGYALSEEFRQGETLTYGQLGIRRIGQNPRIKTIIIENRHEDGPRGAKGMGELPLSMGAPSVVHALHQALGVWITTLPVSPGKIRGAVQPKKPG